MVSQVTFNNVWIGHHSRLPPLFFFFLASFLFCMCRCFACMYVNAPFTCNTWGGQKGMSGFLELELLVVVSYHVLAGN